MGCSDAHESDRGAGSVIAIASKSGCMLVCPVSIPDGSSRFELHRSAVRTHE